MVPVGFMISNHLTKHSFKNFVNGLYLTISLWIIQHRVFMVKNYIGTHFLHHLITERGFVISNDGLWDSKYSYDMIEQEESGSLTIFRICRHGLSPFCGIVNGYNDVTMPPG